MCLKTPLKKSNHELRPYQQNCVEHALKTKAKRLVVVIPTGGGKSFTMWALVQRLLAQKKRVLIVAHRRELIEQLAEYGECGIICAGYDPHPERPVQVASVQTLLSRGTPDFEPDVISVDEAHHYSSKEWRKLLTEHYPNARVIGWTATPVRACSKRPLGDVFDELYVGVHPHELVEQGHLVPAEIYRPSEYQPGALATHAFDAYQKYIKTGSCIVYMSSVEAAKNCALRFCAEGIRARAVSGETPTAERDEIVAEFKAGNIDVLTGVHIFLEGFNYPGLKSIIIARSMSHPVSWLQACGRVLRSTPGKKSGIIVDLAGLSWIPEFGSPLKKRFYSLEKGICVEDSKDLRVRDCPACGSCSLSAVQVCECGHRFATNAMFTPKIYNKELKKHWCGNETAQPHKDAELNRLLSFARSRSWSLSWVVKQYRKTFGETPPFTAAQKRELYESDLDYARARGYKVGWVSHRYKKLWGCWPP